MTRHDQRWLILGMLIGAVVAGIVATGVYFRIQQSPIAVTAEPAAPASPAGQPAAQLSSGEQAKIGLQTAEVRREALTQDITAIGRVEEPETAITTISTRFGGRAAALFVNFTGQAVQKDDPVAVITITGQPAGKDDPVSS